MLRVIVLFSLLILSLGNVWELTDENFEQKFENGNWIVKFFAPWCGHCKTLAPVLDELAGKRIEGVSIGAVDATIHRKIASKYNVKRFPTIIYKRNGVTGVYDGARTLEALTTFANRLNDPSFITVNDVSELTQLYSVNENVAFVFSYPQNIDESPVVQSAFNNFQAVANELQSHAGFAIMPISEGNSVADGYSIFKIELNRHPIEVPRSYHSVEKLKQYVEANNYPTINKFDNHNFKRLSHLNKTMIMAIVDYKQEDNSNILITALSNAVDSFAAEEVSDYIFGHVDGVRWRPYIKEHNATVSDILVVDTRDDMHANFAITPSTSHIADYVADIIRSVKDKTIVLKPSVPPGILHKIQYRIRDTAPWSYVILSLPVLMLIGSYFTSYPVDEKLKKH